MKISFLGTPEAGEKQCMEKKERYRERKYVLTTTLVNATMVTHANRLNPIFYPSNFILSDLPQSHPFVLIC